MPMGLLIMAVAGVALVPGFNLTAIASIGSAVALLIFMLATEAAGATAFLVGDGGELTGGGIGPFVAGHATRWLSPGLGLTAGGTLRVGSAGGVFTSLSAGLSLRL